MSSVKTCGPSRRRRRTRATRGVIGSAALPAGAAVSGWAAIDIKDLQDVDFVNSHYIVSCTKQGVIKKTQLADFSRPRQTGVNAITIVEGDQLLEAKLTNGTCELMMAIRTGRAIRFPEVKVRSTGRGAIGVSGIDVDDETDEVVGMICVNPETNEHTVLVVSEKGYGKRTSVDEYRITNRGGKGVKTISVTEKTGKLFGNPTI